MSDHEDRNWSLSIHGHDLLWNKNSESGLYVHIPTCSLVLVRSNERELQERSVTHVHGPYDSVDDAKKMLLALDRLTR